MTIKNTQLTFEKHNHLKLAQGPHLAAIAKLNNIDITLPEFEAAACDAPIIFIKDEDSGQFRSVIATGLTMDENLFFTNGRWNATFVPMFHGNAPFTLGRISESMKVDDLVVFVDENSPALGDEGTALFNSDGTPSDYVNATKKSLQNYINFQQMTQAFLNYMVEKELLVKRTFELDILGETVALHGLFIIDQSKVNALSDSEFLTLRQRGYLPLIYAHHSSLNQFAALVKKRIAQRKA